MKTSDRVVTVRLSAEDIKYLSELGIFTNKNRSEVLREMIAMTRNDDTREENILLIRYVTSLLTALVRKMSTSNPNEAEIMINTARLTARKEVTL